MRQIFGVLLRETSQDLHLGKLDIAGCIVRLSSRNWNTERFRYTIGRQVSVFTFM